MGEPLDRNKTDRTHVATATAAVWMESVGMKPVEAEVPISDGWIADLAGVWQPTMTEIRRTHAFKRWGIDDEQQQRQYQRLSRWFANHGSRLTVAVEVKVTSSDRAKDEGRKYCMVQSGSAAMSAAAHLLILAAPASAFPKNKGYHDKSWGLLRLSENCERVVDSTWSIPVHANALHPGQIERFYAGLLQSLDHRTRRSRERQLLKAYRRRKEL